MIDERARHQLYRAVEDLPGTECADTLMSLLPPVGWADVATKDDLRQLEARLDARFAQLESNIDARFTRFESKFDARFSRVDARFADVDAHAAQLESRVERALREQTRTLMLGLVGALVMITSLCLGAIALVA